MAISPDGGVVLYGMDFSVYVRIARLALFGKAVEYRLEHLNPFETDPAKAGPDLHPFGKMPVLRHGDLTLYETQAIVRYVDEGFPGPDLMPGTPPQRARQNQIVGICDSYLYRPLVWGLFVETVSKPLKGEAVDEAVAEAAEAEVVRAFEALTPLLAAKPSGPAGFDAGDVFLAPMMDYGMRSERGARAAGRFPALVDWWRSARVQPCMAATVSADLPPEMPGDRIL